MTICDSEGRSVLDVLLILLVRTLSVKSCWQEVFSSEIEFIIYLKNTIGGILVHGGLCRRIARQEVHSVTRERERANQKFLPLNPGRWKSGKFLLPSFNFAQRYMQKSHILQQLPEICARIKKIDASALPWKIHPNPARLFKFLCNPRGSCGRYPNETPWIFISIRSVLAQVKHKSPTLERTERKSLSKMHPRSEIIQPNRTHIQSTYSKNQPTREPTSANPSPGEAQAA